MQKEANNALLDLEELDEEDLVRIKAIYLALARKEREDQNADSAQ